MQKKSLIPDDVGKPSNFTFFTKNNEKIYLKQRGFVYG